jgi:hypothetical protein
VAKGFAAMLPAGNPECSPAETTRSPLQRAKLVLTTFDACLYFTCVEAWSAESRCSIQPQRARRYTKENQGGDAAEFKKINYTKNRPLKVNSSGLLTKSSGEGRKTFRSVYIDDGLF